MKSFHSLTQPAVPARAYFEDSDTSLYETLVCKMKKLIRQLKSDKIRHPERAGTIDWAINTIETNVNKNTSFKIEVPNYDCYYSVVYEKENNFLQIVKKTSDGVMSIRVFKDSNEAFTE